MKIYVDTDCVEIENNEQIVLTYEELEILTGSKRLTQMLSRKQDEWLLLSRGKHNALQIMDNSFQELEEYIHISTGKKYRCIKYSVTGEAMMRLLVKRGKKTLLLTDEVNDWMIG